MAKPKTPAEATTPLANATDPDFIKASDLGIDVPPEDPATEVEPDEEPEEPTSEEPEPEKEPEDKGSEPADEEPPEPTFEGEDPKPQDQNKRITLDPAVAEALPPEVVKRFNEQVAGVEKVQSQITERAEYYDSLQLWHQAIMDPKTGPAKLKELVDDVSKHLNIDPATILGAPTKAAPETEPGEPELEYESDKVVLDRAVAQAKAMADRAKAEAKAEILEALGIDNPAALKDLLQGSAKAQEETKFAAYVDNVYDKVAAHLKTHDDGWTPTKAMVATALKNLPQFKDRPVTAVRMWYSDERAKHAAGRASRTSEKGPEAIRGAGREGFTFPDDPLEMRASDVLKARGSK